MMGLVEGIGAVVLGSFIVYASWKDHHYNKKFDQCSRKVQKIRAAKIVRTNGKPSAIK